MLALLVAEAFWFSGSVDTFDVFPPIGLQILSFLQTLGMYLFK